MRFRTCKPRKRPMRGRSTSCPRSRRRDCSNRPAQLRLPTAKSWWFSIPPSRTSRQISRATATTRICKRNLLPCTGKNRRHFRNGWNMQNGTRALLMLGCAMCAFAREESSRDFRKSVALPSGRNLRIEHSLGSITVRTQPKNEVDIQATIKCSAETADLARTCADEIKITVQESGTGVLVRTEYPERRNQ